MGAGGGIWWCGGLHLGDGAGGLKRLQLNLLVGSKGGVVVCGIVIDDVVLVGKLIGGGVSSL
jgi:hypothetical protein